MQKESNKRLGELLQIENPDIDTLKEIYNCYCELELTETADVILRRIKNLEKILNKIDLSLNS